MAIRSLQPSTAAFDVSDWLALIAVLFVAIVLRLLFFPGYFGTDEVVYVKVGFEIAGGEWPISTYIGALRYGINLPIALTALVFGFSEFSAAAWSFACSVGEVGLVYALGNRLWGLRAGLFAGLVLALTPLHVTLAGRLLADSPLGFFITLSFVLFYIAESRRSIMHYIPAGLSAGFTYWIKEAAVINVAVFGLYAIWMRTWRHEWLWMAAGAAAVIGANCLMFAAMTGDPLYVFKIVQSNVENIFLATTPGSPEMSWYQDRPGFYFEYLFVNVVHTWTLAYLAALGLAVGIIRRRGKPIDAGFAYVAIWGVGLILVFSFFVISFHPFRWIAKQSNYMSIFLAPLALLAAYGLDRLRGRLGVVLVVVFAAGAIPLSALEQQVIDVFTANSKAAVAFARQHDELPYYANAGAKNYALYDSLLRQGRVKPLHFELLRDLAGAAPTAAGASGQGPARAGAAYAIVDWQTMGWGNGSVRVKQVPTCWRRVARLEPTGFGAGRWVALGVLRLFDLLPAAIADRAKPHAAALVQPQPAEIYEVPADCAFSFDG
jgi:4-amino-4-deoxy-L-arabinose transferase-like glycosyltransferase